MLSVLAAIKSTVRRVGIGLAQASGPRTYRGQDVSGPRTYRGQERIGAKTYRGQDVSGPRRIGAKTYRGQDVSGPRRVGAKTIGGAVSPLRELERPPRLGLAVLLALDHAAVAGQEAAALEDAAQLRLEIRQCLGEAVAHRAGLTGQSAARHPADDVVLAVAIGQNQRLRNHHAQYRSGKENFDLPVVDGDFAGAALDPDAGDGVLAFAGGVGATEIVELLDIFGGFRGGRLERRQLIERLHRLGHDQALLTFLRFIAAISNGSGVCAAWG